MGSRWDALMTSPADLWAVDLSAIGFDPLLILRAFTEQRVSVPSCWWLRRGTSSGSPILLAVPKEWHGPFDMLVAPYLPRSWPCELPGFKSNERHLQRVRSTRSGCSAWTSSATPVTVAARRLPLTLTEFRILHDLVAADGRVVPKRHSGGTSAQARGREQAAEVHVRRLREKLVAGGLDGRVIRAVRGVGYQLDIH
jgi:hypothetical protein